MPTYRYKAKKEDGTIIEENGQAPDKFTLYRDAKKKGIRIIHAEELAHSGTLWSRLDERVKKLSTVGTHDVIIFARNLGLMIKAGLSLSRALSVLRRQAQNARLKAVIKEIEEDINGGSQLYEALEKHPKVFSNLFTSMVKAGEEGGNLAEALAMISDQMDRTHSLTKKVRGAMIYPAVIIVVMVAIGVLAMVYIVPTLTGTFKQLGVELPMQTKVLIAISDYLVNYGLLNSVLLLVFIMSSIWFLRTKTGHRVVDFIFLHIPIISGITKQVNAARTTRTLSSLLSSGVDYVIAIGITQEVVQNSYYKEILGDAQEGVKHGETISSILAKHEDYYPVFVSEMASVGEETGQISDLFQNTAEYYEEEVNQKTKNMSTIIEPVLMVIMGIAVGLFAFSMLTPIYSLMDAL